MLTIAFITARQDPRFDWFFQSLAIQPQRHLVSQIILVDFFAEPCDDWKTSDVDQRWVTILGAARSSGFDHCLSWVPPKPNVWSGPHRLTKENWWSCSASRNTAICLCRNDWLVFLDDRAILMPEWLSAAVAAMQSGYVVCGTYEKVNHAQVQAGRLVKWQDIGCRDSRVDMLALNPTFHGTTNPYRAAREWLFTCSIALPLEWALNVNGFDEMADSLSGEDTAFGWMLYNNGYPLAFDLRMKVIQDRTPGQIGPLMKRTDKGISPADKSHAYVDNIRHARRALHWWNLRLVRKAVLAGQPFPIPTGPTIDWWDQQPIKEFA